MFFAHSLDDGEKICWQPLRAHLRAVGELAGAKGHKFGASKAASLAGLLHDLGKYSVAFQRRLEGGDKLDHATAGAQEILKLAQTNQDRVVAHIIAHAIAGHHAGLPDSIGELDQRLKKAIEALDPVWCDEINPDTKGLTPSGFDWGSKDTRAFRLAFLGRMLFSCLVDADFRDTERFYCEAEGRVADRDWPELPRAVDDLIARFDCYMARKRAGADDTPDNRLRGEILSHVRERATSDHGLFTLTVPTGGGKTLSSLA
ncbi:MAG: CRISPR-associated endonuclease Cas3'', partial [Acidobacteria bacterium]|nr:CRISPR-associated endonuclease Cas3'' [Acidobacteriota bacterium]